MAFGIIPTTLSYMFTFSSLCFYFSISPSLPSLLFEHFQFNQVWVLLLLLLFSAGFILFYRTIALYSKGWLKCQRLLVFCCLFCFFLFSFLVFVIHLQLSPSLQTALLHGSHSMLLPSHSGTPLLPFAGFWASTGGWQGFTLVHVQPQLRSTLCPRPPREEGTASAFLFLHLRSASYVLDLWLVLTRYSLMLPHDSRPLIGDR